MRKNSTPALKKSRPRLPEPKISEATARLFWASAGAGCVALGGRKTGRDAGCGGRRRLGMRIGRQELGLHGADHGRDLPRSRARSEGVVRATIAGVQTVALQTLRAGAPRRAWARASEPALVRAAQRGSSEAFAELFRRHWPRAHRAAWLVVHDATAAEDVAQEAFLAAVRALDRFDRRRPFGPWLHRIVVNRAIDYARARELRREVADAGIEPAVVDRADAPGEDVLAALAALPPDQRAVIVMRHLLGFTPGEIASALGLPRGTVNSRLRRGLDGLQEAVER